MLGWAATAIPLACWYAWVRVHVGAWPFLDPFLALSAYRPYDWPVRGFLALAWAPESRIFLRVVALIAWGTLALTGWQLHRTPNSRVAQGAVLMGLVVVVFGSLQSVNPGEVLRILLPAQILGLVAYGSQRGLDGGCTILDRTPFEQLFKPQEVLCCWPLRRSSAPK